MRISTLLIGFALAVFALAPNAHAQQSLPEATGAAVPAQNVLQMPALPANALSDDEPIRLTPDGPAVIQLSEDAASIIIGNPAHATALLENPRLLMLMPAEPGATKVIALNREGKSILNKHVLVDGGKSQFKRISRVCATAQTGTCKPVSMYYCPGKCYETAVRESGSPTAQATGDVANPVSDAPAPPAIDPDTAIDESADVIQ